MKKAYEELDRFYWSQEELLRYEGEEKRVRDNKSVLDFAQEEGIRLGEKKGMDKGKIEGAKARNREIAKQMLKEGENMEKIIKYTNLSPQWLRRLKAELEKQST